MKKSLREIIELCGNKDYDYIEERFKCILCNEIEDTFTGCFSYKNGEIISLDGDCYYLEDVYDEYEEIEKDGKTILVVTLYDGFVRGVMEVKDRISETNWYHIHNGKLIEGANSDTEPLYKYIDIMKIFAELGVE